jgi:HPr kinase/phosphorylase
MLRRPQRGRRQRPPVGEAAVAPWMEVRELLGAWARPLQLKLVAGRAGLDRRILEASAQRPGLALTGYTAYLTSGRVQLLGKSEADYLAGLRARQRLTVLGTLARAAISCVAVTRGLTAPRELIAAADAVGLPVLSTPLDSTAFVVQLSALLEERLAPSTHLHAVLLEVFGLGVLIQGESGIGKSECALDLVDRGHRLVADDVVEVRRVGDVLEGTSPELTRYHMELRGLGVVNLKDLYGVSAIRVAKRVELIIQLERWEAGKEYERLGLQGESFKILGVEVPLVRMPVAPGRNLALLVEVGARNHLLKERGYDAARRLAEHLDTLIAARARQGRRRRVGGKRP